MLQKLLIKNYRIHMGKTLLYRIFKIGRIPENIGKDIQKEGIIFQDEGIRGAITYTSFRVPGRVYG